MKSVVAVGAGSLILAIAASSYDRVDSRNESVGPQPTTLSAMMSPASYFEAPPAPLARYRATLDHLRPSVGARTTRALAPAVLNDVVKKNCAGCHSDQRKMGNFSLQSFDLATIGATSPIIAEKMIGKLRTGMMPPPGRLVLPVTHSTCSRKRLNDRWTRSPCVSPMSVVGLFND